MGLYIIIESDNKASQQIQETITSLEAAAFFKTYANLDEFYTDIEKNKIADAVSLAVLEFTPGKALREWDEELVKFKKVLGSGTNPELREVQILMTAFDEPHIQHKALLSLAVNNFIFKPFDALILKESINSALHFKERLSTIEIKSNKSKASIGILKDIELVSISELGFVTYSDSLLPIGSVSKYFSPIFSYNKKQSAWAQCLTSFPHPKKENTFVNQFQFYGVEPAFLMNIRKYISANKLRKIHEFAFDLKTDEATLLTKIGILATDLEVAAKLQEDLKNHFKNSEVELIHFHQAADLTKRTNLHEFDTVLNMSELMPDEFSKLFKEGAKHFWLNVKLEDEELRKEISALYKDISYLPIDRSYLYKKIKLHHPELLEKEPSSFLTITCSEKMKSTNLIKISEISEVYVVFNYARELAPKTTREFIFITEDETTLVEIPAFCHYVEPAQAEKGMYLHQFMFFGMTDHYLKLIRLWIMQDYILQNKKE